VYPQRVHANVTVRKNDRIRDQKTGTIYTIDEVVVPTNPAGHSSVRAVLRRVT
jgi:hypothetical protein